MAGKKNVLSSLAVYAEDSEPESDDEAGVETAGSAAGEAREGSWKGSPSECCHPCGAGGKEMVIVPQVFGPGALKSARGPR